MQFLSDVYLRCPDCNGRRYRDGGARDPPRGRRRLARCSIADVLDLTVTEALRVLRRRARGLRAARAARGRRARLRAPRPAGADALGRRGAAPEARRASGGARLHGALTSTTHRGKLFLFDEPTTGLHFEDVAKLLRAFRKLLSAGHSLLVIEHNLDVIRAADWIIDLGPEGGERGGEIVVRRHARAGARASRLTHRPGARGLRRGAERPRARGAGRGRPSRAPHCAAAQRPRSERGGDPQGARAQPEEHRRRHPARPLHGDHRRLRLGQVDARLRHPVQRGPAPLSRVAERLCAAVRAAGGASGCRRDLRHSAHGRHRAAHQPRRAQEHGGDAHRDLSLPAPAVRQARHAVLPRLRCRHRAAERRLDRRAAAARTTAAQSSRCSRRWSWRARATTPTWRSGRRRRAFAACGSTASCCRPRRGRACRASASTPSSCRWPSSTSARRARRRCARRWRARSTSARGWCTCCRRGATRVDGVLDQARLPLLRQEFRRARPAAVLLQLAPRLVRELLRHRRRDGRVRRRAERRGSCGGTSGTRSDAGRLPRMPRAAPESGRAQRALSRALDRRARRRSGEQQRGSSSRGCDSTRASAQIARDLLAEIRARLQFLERVGLGYLQLDRAAPTLSGGEAQRIRLAAQLGSNLQGVCYVLDEPTIGLHPRDNAILLDALDRARRPPQHAGGGRARRGHHPPRRSRARSRVPSAGTRGGELVGAGTVRGARPPTRAPTTGRFLREPLLHPAQPHRPVNARHAAISRSSA